MKRRNLFCFAVALMLFVTTASSAHETRIDDRACDELRALAMLTCDIQHGPGFTGPNNVAGSFKYAAETETNVTIWCDPSPSECYSYSGDCLDFKGILIAPIGEEYVLAKQI